MHTTSFRPSLVALVALLAALRAAPAGALTCSTCAHAVPVCQGDQCGEVCAVADDGTPCYPNACAVGTCSRGVCVPEHVAPRGQICRPAVDACDVAEYCDGTNGVCPPDVAMPKGTVCRRAAGPCDLAETCDGTAASCPADRFKSAQVSCRNAAGVCDVADMCTGTSADCPVDRFVGAGKVCRASLGPCDPAETCTGTSSACPADAFAPAGAACPADADACTVDACDGAGVCAHTPSGDADGDGTCDALDPCVDVGGGQRFVAGSKLAFTHVEADPTAGNDGLALTGAFDLPSPHTFADIAADATGMRVVVTAADGSARVDVTLPGGAYVGKGSRGWTRASNGKTWTWLDKTDAPLGGIVKLQVADKSKAATPTRTKLVVVGKAGVYPVTSADAPLAATITLGTSADAMAGLCGESAYGAGDCASNGAHTKLTCKR